MEKTNHMINKVFKVEKRAAIQLEKHLKNNNYSKINKTLEDDIFIAGYPKSGNTWVQNLIAGAVFGVNTSFLPDKLTQELVPDVHAKTYYKRFLDPTFFKTHELPQQHMKRVIHLVRDGRDVMASYFAMNKAMGKKISMEDMIVSGKGIFPCKWQLHTDQWLQNPFKAEIILIKYEDLINDPYTELKKILAFAGLERPDEILRLSIQGNSFNEMQRKEKKFGWNNKEWNEEETFIRKGKIGNYKEEIPLELISYFENEAGNELKKLGYTI